MAHSHVVTRSAEKHGQKRYRIKQGVLRIPPELQLHDRRGHLGEGQHDPDSHTRKGGPGVCDSGEDIRTSLLPDLGLGVPWHSHCCRLNSDFYACRLSIDRRDY